MVTDHLLSLAEIQAFCSRHGLPEAFQTDAARYYVPLARQLRELRRHRDSLFLGINGAQGTGKSTLAAFLKLACETMFDWNVAILSIDDFYSTKQQRKALANDIHPLLMTRGVPGTHDTHMLAECLDSLRSAGDKEAISLPRFDKSIDDRSDASAWPTVPGPVDLIILEGWCVGSRAQTAAELDDPVNALERREDSKGRWRNYVNQQLRTHYVPIFEQLDALVFLKAPNLAAVHRWRYQQEQQLPAPSRMDEREIKIFVEFFERITKENLRVLPGVADLTFELDDSHEIAACHTNHSSVESPPPRVN